MTSWPHTAHDRFSQKEARRALRWPVGLVLVLTLAGCATRGPAPGRGGVERGTASWYGEKFHGRPTASGEIYDMHALTAAHRRLPLGTVVEVRNLDNGRSVVVRVNDRGPFVGKRVLDLSYGAARELGMVRAGLARVEIRVVRSVPEPHYAVQVGSFRDRDRALALKARLKRTYPTVVVAAGDGWHRVRMGNFDSRAAAEKLRRQMARRGLPAVVVSAG